VKSYEKVGAAWWSGSLILFGLRFVFSAVSVQERELAVDTVLATIETRRPAVGDRVEDPAGGVTSGQLSAVPAPVWFPVG